MFFEDRSLAPYEGDEPYLFLSYSHKDSEKAGKIIRVLKKNGFRVWYDEGITPGAEWDDNVAQAIVDCSYFVALISPGYIASANCRDELNYARTLEKQRLLVYLEETELPPGIAMRVNQLLALHMDKYEAEELFYERLFAAEGIDVCRGEPEPVEAAPEEPADLTSEETEAQQGKTSEPETKREPPAEQEETAGKPADSPAESEQKLKKGKAIGILIPAAILIVLALILLPGKLKKPVPPEMPKTSAEVTEPETPVPPAEPAVTRTEIPAPTPTATPEPTPTPTPTPEPPTPEEQARMDAEKLFEDGKIREAALAFWKIGDEDRSRELWREAAVQKSVATGGGFAIGLKSDGTVLSTGNNTNGQMNVGDWTDIVAVAAGQDLSLGLKADGTVVAAGPNGYGECNVSEWTDIIQIDAGARGSFGLKTDGTVVATGDNKTGRMNVENWTDIVAIAAGPSHTVGLKADGTAIAVGRNQYGQCEVGDWTDIVEIAASQYHTMGLRADGTVVAVGRPTNKTLEVSKWKNIQGIATSDNLTIGLREDGSLVWAGIQAGETEPVNSSPLPGWQDICEINGNSSTNGALKLIGVREDGTVIINLASKMVTINIDDWSDLMTPEQRKKLLSASGSPTPEEQARMDAEKLFEDGKIREAALAFWKLGDENRSRELWRKAAVQKSVATGSYFAIGLKADGTVLSTGENTNGKRNVGEWKDIIAVAAGPEHTLGLRANGTVIATGSNSYGECNVSDWTNIIQIDAGGRGSFGLKADGTVVAAGENRTGRMNINDWTNIVAIAAGPVHTVGLKADGTVVAVGYNQYGQCDVGEWYDIIQISASQYHTIGLKADGSVVAVGRDAFKALEVTNWRKIKDTTTSTDMTVGLREDGSLIWAGNQAGESFPNSTPLTGWQDICEISGSSIENAFGIKAIGVREDGTAVMLVVTKLPTANVDNWSDLMTPEKRRMLSGSSHSPTEEEQARIDAEKLYEDGKTREAALAFWKLGDEDRSCELWREAAIHKSIAIGAFHAVGLKTDGTVLSTGNNPDGQCNVADWTDIIAVAAGDRHTLGLKADGTVVATGMNSAGECKLEEWKDIIQIAAGDRMSFGLKSDGTVVAEGLDRFGLKNVSDWTDVAAIAASSAHVVGLKTDGTVIAAGINDDGQCSIEDWADIIEIDVGARHTLGLKADGTVIAVGENKRNACEVSNWRNIRSIAAAQRLSVGIREDGTLIWAGIQGKSGLSGFQNVSDMCGYGGTIKDSGLLILLEDGTVAGDMYTRGGSVDDWSDLMIPGNKM